MLNVMRLGLIGLTLTVTLSTNAYEDDYSSTQSQSFKPTVERALYALAYAGDAKYQPAHYRSYRHKRYNRGYRYGSRSYRYGHGYRRGYYKGRRHYRGYRRDYRRGYRGY